LNHPNILSLFDIGKHNETHYIVSELIKGESLRRFIERGLIPIRKYLEIAVQIADALAAVPQGGIVYRDLKPEFSDWQSYRHEMATGTHPFARKTAVQTLSAIIGEVNTLSLLKFFCFSYQFCYRA